MADYGELGTFSTEYPWSDVSSLDLGYSDNVLSVQYSDSTFGILGSRPAVIPDHPDSIQTYFSFGFLLISARKLKNFIVQSKISLLTSNMDNLNDRVNFDLKNIATIEDIIIPKSKTLIYCHGWKANSGWFSQLFSSDWTGPWTNLMITKIS